MSTRFDVRIDGEPVLLIDDAAAVCYLLSKLTDAGDVDRVLLAAELARSEMIEAGNWKLPADVAEFGAAVRAQLFTPDDLPAAAPPLVGVAREAAEYDDAKNAIPF